MGAALWVWHCMLNQPRESRHPDSQEGSFLGPAFDSEGILLFLDAVGAKYQHINEENVLLDRVARLLDEGKVIGWFHGRMEYGPRALGHRSILGDARSSQMQRVMNQKIKFRESFRPFAPVVLRECADQVFDMPTQEDSPYMLFVSPVREDWRIPIKEEDQECMRSPDLRVRVSVPRSKIPAITHMDYSARVQTVDEGRHGRFYGLLKRFHELTDCPVLVNTSFNIRGEPIVCTPEDAYRCFLATDMDVLVLEDCLLMKQSQTPEFFPGVKAYKSEYKSILD